MPMTPRRVIWTVAALMSAAMLTGPAFGQLDRDKRKEEKPDASKAPPAPKPPPAPPKPTERLAPLVLKHTRSRDWTMTVELRVEAGEDRSVIEGQRVETPRAFAFRTAAFVFPILRSSASHEIELDANQRERIKGELFWNERLYDSTPTFQDGYQSGTRLARWEVRDVEGQTAKMSIEQLITTWDTVYDEDLAMKIDWPATWPAVPASALRPQLFVESDSPEVRALLQRWTEGLDKAKTPPAQLAKILTGKVLEFTQPSGNGMVFTRAGEVMGFDLKGAQRMAVDPKGSPHDIVCLHAAVLRAAGIPARTVIGYDQTSKDGGSGLGGSNSKSPAAGMRSWVEFALVDPFDGKEFWIPVDLNRLRRTGSKAPPLSRSWKYFGTHDELSFVLPIAFQYHPPTTVAAAAPAFWGWLTSPSAVPQQQSLKVRATRTPQAGGEPNRRGKSKGG